MAAKCALLGAWTRVSSVFVIAVTASAIIAAAAIAGTSSASAADWNCQPEARAQHKLEPPTLQQPYNIGQLKFLLRDYYFCGGYAQDFATVVAEASAYLHQHASEYKKPALVLDIDETSLSNWVEIDQDDFGFIPGGACPMRPGMACGDLAWELSSRATALKPTLALFKDAKAAHIPVFFITGRRDQSNLRLATIKNLNKVGYHHWDGLVMRPILSTGSVAAFKSKARADLEARGYTVVVNMGDQESDLDGGAHAKKAIRLPNPFYFIP
jgi:acid phosphatase